MQQQESFQCLRKGYMRNIDKSVRYNHHIRFLDNFISQKSVPKGFKISFHGVLPTVESSSILFKCSKKLMARTIAFYKRRVTDLEVERNSIHQKISNFYPNYVNQIFEERTKKESCMNKMLGERRKKKYLRDGILPEKNLGAPIPPSDPTLST